MNGTALTRFAWLASAAVMAASPAWAQGFDSGSDGSDGALTFPADAGVVVFDPASYDPPLDPDGDGVYHFTTIEVGANTTVRLGSSVLGEGRPVVWLTTGDVLIEGTLDLDGAQGHQNSGPRIPAEAGAGGYTGGVAQDGMGSISTAGNGPGGGLAPAPTVTASAGGGSYASAGQPGQVGAAATYGSAFLLPLLGGSGGGGGGHATPTQSNISGGGGGGGAILIASNTQIQVNGSISASGGPGGNIALQAGGGGSGGAIRLIAPRLLGTGSLRALGGAGIGGNNGGVGRIRMEGLRREGPSNVSPAPSVASPGPISLPPTAPLIRLVSIDGVAVSASPTGSFDVPDAVISNAGPVDLVIEASNIPDGTEVNLTLRPETGPPVTAVATLSGTQASSTATVSVTLSSGFTRLFLQADWTP